MKSFGLLFSQSYLNVSSQVLMKKAFDHSAQIISKSCIKPKLIKMLPRPFRVSIEGNIGSGKSTCLEYFKKWDEVEIHPEPISKWRDLAGENLLGLLYTDLKKWNFPFQHYVHLTRLQIQTSEPSSEKITVKMFERSVQNNRYCFMENALKNNHLSECEFKILEQWYECMAECVDISLDLIVYLRTTPDVVYHRMLKRGRSEEATVPFDYLKQVHESYESWLNNPENVPCKILTIDADQDIDNVIDQLSLHSRTILNKNNNQENIAQIL